MNIEFGVMFHDGSVRHPWNGRTQLQHAVEECRRLRREYPGDNIRVVWRQGNGEWRPLSDFKNLLNEA